MHIEYLAHTSIDKSKWDQAILNSDNGMVYACSWYLDCVSPGWEAIIANDYEYLFPVPVKRKYKIPYIVQPFLAQQLGLFGRGIITETMLQAFLNKLPSYSYEINLNFANVFTDAVSMTNLILPLHLSYEEIRAAYSTNTLRNIRKALKHEYIFRPIAVDDFIKVYRTVDQPDTTVNIELIEQLIRTGEKWGYLHSCAMVTKNGTIVSGLVYGRFKNRISYLFPVSTTEGKQSSAMFILVDELLKENAGSTWLFDFEGSMVEGVARFYSGFGAQPENYHIVKQLRPSFLVGKI